MSADNPTPILPIRVCECGAVAAEGSNSCAVCEHLEHVVFGLLELVVAYNNKQQVIQ
jgi:hypothetical protein